MHGIVAYTFLNVREKIHQFLSSIKKDARKRKFVPFFLHHGVVCTSVGCAGSAAMERERRLSWYSELRRPSALHHRLRQRV